MADVKPAISVIIVSYNVSELLDTCLRTLHEYTKVPYEVIVVDSASSDDSVAMVEKTHPWVKLISCTENVGFTRGNNMGLAAAKGQDILFLNPDVEFFEDAIGPLLSELHTRPDVGIIGPKLLNTDRSLQSSIGYYTSLRMVVNEFVFWKMRKSAPVKHPNEPTVVEVLLGAFLLVKGSELSKIGGFDERYFMYNEETDLCLSMKKRGFVTLYFPKVAVIHHGSKSATKTPEIRQRSLHIARVSMLKYLSKHYGFATVFLGRLIMGLSLVLRVPWLLLRHFSAARADADLKLRYYGYTMQWILTGRRVGY